MKNIYLRLLQLVLLCTISLSSFSQAPVQWNMLDWNFARPDSVHVGGIQYTSFAPMTSRSKAVVVDKYQKIILAGDNGANMAIVVRLKTDGHFDSTFATNGRLTTVLDPSGSNATAASVVLQNDGKIVWAGTIDNKVTLVRYHANGVIDNSFGTSGIVIVPRIGNDTMQVFNALVDTAINKIYVGGAVHTPGQFKKFMVMRFNMNGTPDNTFGTNGLFSTGYGSHDVFPHGLGLLSQNRIVIGGSVYNDTADYDFAVLCVLPNGTVDNTYGNNGFALTDFHSYPNYLTDLAVLQDYVEVVGKTDYGVLPWEPIGVARLDSMGHPDLSWFGTYGKSEMSFSGHNDNPVKILWPENFAGGYGGLICGTTDSGYFAATRLQLNGDVDREYGYNGVGIVKMPGLSGNVYGAAWENGADSLVRRDTSGNIIDTIYIWSKLLLTGSSLVDSVTEEMVTARYDENGQAQCNQIVGYIYVDQNLNHQRDSAEVLYKDKCAVTLYGGRFWQTTGTHTGYFNVCSHSLGALVTVTPEKPYFMQDTTNIPNIGHSTFWHMDTVQIGLIPVPAKRDLATDIFPVGYSVHPGQAVSHELIYRNKGTDTVPAGYVLFVKDSRETFTTASVPPSSINGDTLRWNYTDLKTQDADTIIVEGTLPNPPAINIGDVICSQSFIFPDTSDVELWDNHYRLCQTVSAGYDPNVKSEIHGGSISITQVAARENLEYTITFQNTGNDTAQRIVVTDVLDNNLDTASFSMETASHNYQVSRVHNLVTWTFDNINLPDSGSSDAGSHGQITFRIKPKATLNVGDVINNTANIYFDNNAAVTTNTQRTEVTGSTLPVKLLVFTANKAGKANLLQWRTAHEVNTDRFEIERSANGRAFVKIGSVRAIENGLSILSNDYQFNDDAPLSALNYYRLRIVDKDGRFDYSPVRVINTNANHMYVSVYPNPARDKVQVMLSSATASDVQVQVVSQDGKVLLSTKWKLDEGTAVKTINTGSLQSGNYYLRIISPKEQNVVQLSIEQ